MPNIFQRRQLFRNRRAAAYISDADAAAFVTAAGITDPTQIAALHNLVTALKAAGVWSKCLAIYPFVGGTSTTHKYNLKDPRDLDAAFRIAFSGTITHDANGITPDGSTGYGDTKFNGITQGVTDNSHLSVYVRTDTAAGDKTEINAYNGFAAYWGIKAKQTGDVTFHGMYSFSADGFISVSGNTDARGFYTSVRRGAADGEAYKNGVSVGTDITNSSQDCPSTNIHIGKRGDTTTSFTDRNIAFASIGTALSDQETADFYTAVQAFQTALSRNI